jgi:hypothetical protein
MAEVLETLRWRSPLAGDRATAKPGGPWPARINAAVRCYSEGTPAVRDNLLSVLRFHRERIIEMLKRHPE